MRIPIYILTGFLGSGKTTVLNRCLTDPRFGDSAVLINEFGEVGLDHLLVKNIDEEVVVLESGCVCCSVRDDFTTALLGLSRRRNRSRTPKFRRVVLETTGIADPNAVHQVLITDSEVRKRYRYGGTITVVDGVFGLETLDQHIEAVLQVALADGLLISKTDLTTTDRIDSLKARLLALNPVIRLQRDQNDLSDLLEWFEHNPRPEHDVKSFAAELNTNSPEFAHCFRTFRITQSEPFAWEVLKEWLEVLLFARGGDIYRIKGWANIKGESLPVIVQSVQHALYPPQTLDAWPASDRCTELTFICRNFTRSAALCSLLQICDQEVSEAALDKSRHANRGVTAAMPPFSSVEVPGVQAMLHVQWQKLVSSGHQRPWYMWSLHNPWSLASTVVDSWSMLAICQSPPLLDAIANLIGPDIVLYDCALQPLTFAVHGVGAWCNDTGMFPIEPVAGAVARLPLVSVAGVLFHGGRQGDRNFFRGASLDRFIIHNAVLDYRYEGLMAHDSGYEFVIRYFPATSRYLRDPENPSQLDLMECFPLFNYARLPLWLVRGEDRANNDFVTGFQVKSGYWTAA